MRVEVLDAQEEPDAAGELVPDRARLLAVGAGEQEAGLGTRRPHDDPALGRPVVGQRRRVLDELEAERVDEERDRRVVLVDDQGEARGAWAASKLPTATGSLPIGRSITGVNSVDNSVGAAYDAAP